MSLLHFILKKSSLRHKIVVIALLSSIVSGVLGVYALRSEWIFSLICGCLSYVLLMTVTFQTICTKITQKIQEADTEQTLLKYTSQHDDTQDIAEKAANLDSKPTDIMRQESATKKECFITNTINKKDKNKARLKFIDLSKASLGFEISFSLSRILVFIGMIFCCVVLVWFGVFYPFVYLFGVLLGVVCIMSFLLIKRWCDNYNETA